MLVNVNGYSGGVGPNHEAVPVIGAGRPGPGEQEAVAVNLEIAESDVLEGGAADGHVNPAAILNRVVVEKKNRACVRAVGYRVHPALVEQAILDFPIARVTGNTDSETTAVRSVNRVRYLETVQHDGGVVNRENCQPGYAIEPVPSSTG